MSIENNAVYQRLIAQQNVQASQAQNNNRSQGFDFGILGYDPISIAERTPPRMWLEDLGYDKRAQRVCFHGGCSLLSPCVRLDVCIGRPTIVREQAALWAEHQKRAPEADAPYAFWLGADA